MAERSTVLALTWASHQSFILARAEVAKDSL